MSSASHTGTSCILSSQHGWEGVEHIGAVSAIPQKNMLKMNIFIIGLSVLPTLKAYLERGGYLCGDNGASDLPAHSCSIASGPTATQNHRIDNPSMQVEVGRVHLGSSSSTPASSRVPAGFAGK